MPNNDLQPLPLALLTAGGVLVYAAVKNKQPLGLIKAVLTGGDVSKVPALYTASTALGPGVVPNSQLPGKSGDGTRTDPPGFNPNDPNTGVIPVLPGEGGGGSGVVAYRTPFSAGSQGGFV